MEFISWVSAHAGQNSELCLSAYPEYYGNTIRVAILLQVSKVPIYVPSSNGSMFVASIQIYAINVIGKRPSGPK